MDTAKLWFMLLCVCGIWILSLALDCDWTTEYENNKTCCKSCPSDKYPKEPCFEPNGESVCEKCPPASTDDSNKCFCIKNHACGDDKCSSCKALERCKPGHQLRRFGKFKYNFVCDPCPNGTYNDAEDSTCKAITKCVGVGETFPGNQTHNARCVSPDYPKQNEVPNGSQYANSFLIVACLTVTVLTCLVLIMYMAFQIAKYKKFIKLHKPYSQRMVLPSDACSCKLSKEEMGDKSNTKTEDFEDLEV